MVADSFYRKEYKHLSASGADTPMPLVNTQILLYSEKPFGEGQHRSKVAAISLDAWELSSSVGMSKETPKLLPLLPDKRNPELHDKHNLESYFYF